MVKSFNDQLLECVAKGNINKANFLLALKADVNYVYNDCHLLCYANDDEMMDFLLKKGADIEFVNSKKETPLISAIANDKFDNAKRLIKFGANVEACNSWKNSVLFLAIDKRDLELIKTILKKKPNIEQKGDFERTALFYCISHGFNFKDVAEHLIEAGADVNAKDVFNSSCLLYACEYTDDLEGIKCLVENGADINYCIDEGINNPLVVAAQRNKWDIVKYLSEVGGDVNCPFYSGMRALSYAVLDNNLEMVNFLISKGALVNEVDNNGRGALWYACNSVFATDEIIKVLVSCGANPNMLDNKGESPVMIANRAEREVIFKTLKEVKAKKTFDNMGKVLNKIFGRN